MPKSRVRKKTVYTPPPSKSVRKKKVSPPWVGPAIVASLVIGLAWIAAYYMTQGSIPGMSSVGAWNLVIGFGFIIGGVVLSTRWH